MERGRDPEKRYRRVFVLVLDGVGIGALPDAQAFGDAGADTVGHVAAARGLAVPHLASLGLARLVPALGAPGRTVGCFGRLAEISPGKDTTTGHWELMGLPLERPFPVYPDGFPPEVMEPFQAAVGREALWNRPASGTEILARFGAEHMATGRPIVYTSADSVFQIAAHEDVVPVEELYRWCRAARDILTGPHAVSRVIARPFTGTPGSFHRTPRRLDVSVSPPGDTVLDLLSAAGLEVIGVGKIEDIFAHRGLTSSDHTADTAATLEAVERAAGRDFEGLCLANCIDFDMLYGHRRDPEGFGRALEAFDAFLPRIFRALRGGDLLILTADHGNDPLHGGSDHTREYVPLLAWAPGFAGARDLGTRPMADLGATLAGNFGVETHSGTSFIEDMAGR